MIFAISKNMVDVTGIEPVTPCLQSRRGKTLKCLSLALAGIYGVMAYTVAQRSREIGLRMALGATAQNVVWMMLRRGIQIVAVGLLIGLVGAAASARLLRTMLFQVRPNDPVVYLAVAVLLGLVALVASYVPARRASKIDPLVALRQE